MTLIYAHRGSSGRYPENTLLAFRKALESGVAGIELDVHVTAERIPVVIHDRDVGRTTNGSGNVDEIPSEQLRAFDAGRDERVPTLAEVVDLVRGSVRLDVEVKGHGIEVEVLRVLAEYAEARWAISSFDWDTLRRLRALDARAELWPLATVADDALFAIATELGSPAVSLFAGALTTEAAGALRDAGLEAMVWTVNEAAEAKRVRDLGAFALCTDYPDRIAAALSIR
jgi:glycerophosphoryl diester phosphodiesterase